MKPVLDSEIREVVNAVHYRPAITIILPFEPKMSLKSEISQSLKFALDKVEKELKQEYPDEVSELMMHKLSAIVNHLNYNTHKKSIAIYISPVFEKVLYLDMPVDEKIVINESFEIRDLVYSKKELHKYLVLLLSNKESRMYLGNTTTFVRIVSNTPESVYAYINEVPQPVGNFSDKSARKEVIMEKFLHHVDNALGLILKTHQLPLFIVGTDRIIGHFSKLSKHNKSVVDSIHGNYEDESPDGLKKLLEPYVTDWKKVKQKDLLNLLEDSADNRKLAVGMNEVWQQAMSHKGRLLVVEKNYTYAAERNDKNIVPITPESYNKFSYIKDAVDDVIEKVLESGGDVEFVDPDVLISYNRIALVQYY